MNSKKNDKLSFFLYWFRKKKIYLILVIMENCDISKGYDYIIIGTGPSSLTCAYYLSKSNKKVLLVDENNMIGGCYQITRVNGLFSEQIPRFYSEKFINFKNLLFNMDTNYNNLFNPINNNIRIPKEPNDTNLFNIWLQNIINTGNCSILFNSKIEKINYSDNIITINSKNFKSSHIITEDCERLNCLTIYFHWNIKLNLQSNYSKENIIILTDYMYFNDIRSITVISITLDKIKNNEIINDAFNMIKKIFINLPEPTNISFSDVKYTETKSKLGLKVITDPISIEKSIINAIKLLHTLEPTTKKTVSILIPENIFDVLQYLFMISFILYIFKEL